MVVSWLHLSILLALFVAILFAGGPLIASRLLAPRSTGGDIQLPYECGIRPMGVGQSRFSMNYYLYALLFLAFDVDVLYLFPVAGWYPQSQGWAPLAQVAVFLVILAAGCLYFWKKGVFEWPRRIQ